MTSAVPSALDEPPADAPRFLRAFWRLVRWAMPVQFRFFGLYEYRIANVYAGPLLDLQATGDTIAVGLADIPKVPAWPGVSGFGGAPTGASRVLVQFINGSAARPVVVAWAPAGDSGWLPASATLDATGSVTVGGTASAVNVGGAGGGFLQLAGPLATWATAVTAALGSAGHPVTPLVASATTKAKGV